ncbi:galactose-3-O-sulfotransferase 3 [Elysia marginata]|uniref:Galactose-3-O-sulfotransferase 3 n=1 Tax=Elysia marginata TaxID=1093978 RepID=A0AAV4I9X0_9GAST|nr:galactose-3-O-sulfotransferase 3 [Elysia marginata]
MRELFCFSFIQDFFVHQFRLSTVTVVTLVVLFILALYTSRLKLSSSFQLHIDKENTDQDSSYKVQKTVQNIRPSFYRALNKTLVPKWVQLSDRNDLHNETASNDMKEILTINEKDIFNKDQKQVQHDNKTASEIKNEILNKEQKQFQHDNKTIHEIENEILNKEQKQVQHDNKTKSEIKTEILNKEQTPFQHDNKTTREIENEILEKDNKEIPNNYQLLVRIDNKTASQIKKEIQYKDKKEIPIKNNKENPNNDQKQAQIDAQKGAPRNAQRETQKHITNQMNNHTQKTTPQNIESGSQNETRNEIRQIVFAKIHKAASSTLQNILLRFAMSRNLDVLLPKKQDHINEFSPRIDPDSIVPRPQGKPFDILCNHLVFNADEIAAYIPRSAFRFGILREPLSQTLSALQYYSTFFLYPGTRLHEAVQKHAKDPIQGFLNHPSDFCDEKGGKARECSIDNRMSMDLGLFSGHLLTESTMFFQQTG